MNSKDRLKLLKLVNDNTTLIHTNKKLILDNYKIKKIEDVTFCQSENDTIPKLILKFYIKKINLFCAEKIKHSIGIITQNKDIKKRWITEIYFYNSINKLIMLLQFVNFCGYYEKYLIYIVGDNKLHCPKLSLYTNYLFEKFNISSYIIATPQYENTISIVDKNTIIKKKIYYSNCSLIKYTKIKDNIKIIYYYLFTNDNNNLELDFDLKLNKANLVFKKIYFNNTKIIEKDYKFNKSELLINFEHF